ncbi:hypothetical protein D3C78_1117260 [compost metagenome]
MQLDPAVLINGQEDFAFYSVEGNILLAQNEILAIARCKRLYSRIRHFLIRFLSGFPARRHRRTHRVDQHSIVFIFRRKIQLYPRANLRHGMYKMTGRGRIRKPDRILIGLLSVNIQMYLGLFWSNSNDLPLNRKSNQIGIVQHVLPYTLRHGAKILKFEHAFLKLALQPHYRKPYSFNLYLIP